MIRMIEACVDEDDDNSYQDPLRFALKPDHHCSRSSFSWCLCSSTPDVSTHCLVTCKFLNSSRPR